MNTDTDILPRTTVSAVIAHRDAALAQMGQAVDLLQQGFEVAKKSLLLAEQAHGSTLFSLSDRSRTKAYSNLFENFSPADSLECFRQEMDARTWIHLLTLTGIKDLMDRTAKEDLYKDLCGEVPEITEGNIKATVENLAVNAKLIFQRGLARAFIALDRRFKSHDAFKLGSRIILTGVFNQWGFWNHGRSGNRDTLTDVERVFAVLDGQQNPDPDSIVKAIEQSRAGGGCNPRQSETETAYFRIRCFQNGNAHLWFKRDDLVQKANETLADYYGEVLPDGVPDDMPDSDLRSKTGALSKDLAFYPTPPKVVAKILQNTYIDKNAHILEPSAGTGNMVRELLKLPGARVDAVEVHPDRAAALRRINDLRVTVLERNFLRMIPQAKYNHVVMNPPFHGTHWMEHVRHAFDFLAPGGTLIAVLPISAQLGESKRHLTFHKWAEQYRPRFNDLPPESFQESGIRINTVYLSLTQKTQ